MRSGLMLLMLVVVSLPVLAGDGEKLRQRLPASVWREVLRVLPGPLEALDEQTTGELVRTFLAHQFDRGACHVWVVERTKSAVDGDGSATERVVLSARGRAVVSVMSLEGDVAAECELYGCLHSRLSEVDGGLWLHRESVEAQPGWARASTTERWLLLSPRCELMTLERDGVYVDGKTRERLEVQSFVRDARDAGPAPEVVVVYTSSKGRTLRLETRSVAWADRALEVAFGSGQTYVLHFEAQGLTSTALDGGVQRFRRQ